MRIKTLSPALISSYLVMIGCDPTTMPVASTAPSTKPGPVAGDVIGESPKVIPGVNNFARISPVLYRGEQPTEEGFATLKKLGVKTIVNLRSFHGDSDHLKGLGFRYFHIYAKAWHPEDEDMVAFLQIVNDPANQPVFVHCQHGADRTGYAVAVYRMVEQGWSAEQAIAEMKRFAFHSIWIDIPAYLNCLDVKSIRQEMAKSPKPKLRIVD